MHGLGKFVEIWLSRHCYVCFCTLIVEKAQKVITVYHCFNKKVVFTDFKVLFYSLQYMHNNEDFQPQDLVSFFPLYLFFRITRKKPFFLKWKHLLKSLILPIISFILQYWMITVLFMANLPISNCSLVLVTNFLKVIFIPIKVTHFIQNIIVCIVNSLIPVDSHYILDWFIWGRSCEVSQSWKCFLNSLIIKVTLKDLHLFIFI